jgi:hypothetical protein
MLRHYREAGRLLLGLALSLGMAAFAAGGAKAVKTIPVKVSAKTQDYQAVPVSVVVPNGMASGVHDLPRGVSATTCQAEPAGPGQTRLTFVVQNLKKGESRTYELQPTGSIANGPGVTILKNGNNADILVNGALFTRYDTTTGPNKPYFFPLNGPNGKSIVRKWPVEQTNDETKDHPHHRGMWFTHARINGVDFWVEKAAKLGKTVHTGYDATDSGPVYGVLKARTDWIMPDGKKVAEDVRDIRVYPLANGYLMDFTVGVKAVGGPLVWGDNKDGCLGIRVADSIRAAVTRDETTQGKVAQGKIVNSAGQTQAGAWGKAAAWCDYYGPVDGETVGVAIFDAPTNLRHPTTWHVRDYGLFAVNPFGLHDFDPTKKNDLKAGEYTTPEGQTTTFRYRLYFHKGTTEEANVPQVYAGFADPPTVDLVAGEGGKR